VPRLDGRKTNEVPAVDATSGSTRATTNKARTPNTTSDTHHDRDKKRKKDACVDSAAERSGNDEQMLPAKRRRQAIKTNGQSSIQTTALYGVTVAAPRKNDAPLSKSKSKITSRISCGSGVSADSDSQSDAEMQPTIGGLPSDEDDSLERDWALSSRLTGKEAQKLTQVIKSFFVPFFR
jgi:hypothetical protein